MDCLACASKACRTEKRDCNGLRDTVKDTGRTDALTGHLQNADGLVADGKAGTLSRVDEIIEYARLENIGHIALAYCFAVEEQAALLRDRVRTAGLRVSSVRCTVNGITENELLANGKETVNCNPVGQAEALNRSDAGLVIEMGLCLGHDVLFHRYLKKPVTVFMVKDRVHGHIPQQALQPATDPAAEFLISLPSDFYLRSRDWVEERLAGATPPVIVDLRASSAFIRGTLPGGINSSQKDIADHFKDILPDKKATVVCLCNGGLQSLYTVMFLRLHGYTEAYSLTGGFARWQEENRPVVQPGILTEG